MDINKVKELIELLKSSDISEIELTEEGTTIRVSRAQYTPPHQTQPHIEHYIQSAQSNPSLQPTQNPEPKTQSKGQPELSSKDRTITSPMVGTFYRASSPNDKPFVDIDSTVKVGQVLCIIEAMKMLNQIESEYAGVIKSVLVENGQPVEFGQPLFVISE